ncbi:MAG: polysaccharide deacetylase family protein [Jejuia sp.]
MALVPIKTPKVVKALFPNYIWNIDTTDKIIYLTFDDGPTPKITDWTLDILEQYKAKATFFCIGANVEKQPDVFKKILKNGHSVGNHTQHHTKGWKTSKDSYLKDVEKAQNTLNHHLLNSEFNIQKLFRPPYGKITRTQGKSLLELGYNIVMWDVLSFDWDKNTTKEACTTNVISKAKKGSIIVFHDSVKSADNMQYALPRVLEHFGQKGYQFKSLEF